MIESQVPWSRQLDSPTFSWRSVYSIWLAVAAVMIGAVPCEAADDVFSYQFNAADQLGSVTLASGGGASFGYDGDGLRTRKEAAGDTVFYLRDDAGNVIAEYDQNGTLLAEYVYSNSQRVARIEPGDQRSYYHADIVGTPQVITDGSGNESFRGDYRPFGTEEKTTGARDRRSFTGKEYDGEFGLFYFNARYYDSTLGRFISVDPASGNVGALQSWNRYVYVTNNPLTLIDPTGELTQVLLGLHTKDNVFGHIAVAINGEVYSFGTNRTRGRNKDWGASLDKYLAAQNSERGTRIIDLDISQDQEVDLLLYLVQHNPNVADAPPYDLMRNSCVTVQEKAFESVGVLSNEPGQLKMDRRGDPLQAGAQKSLTPASLVRQLDHTGLAGSSATVGTETVSYIRSAINTVLSAVGS